MNWEQVQGNWKQYAGRIREKWGKLTHNDLQVIVGKRDQLVGRIQKSYGIAKERLKSRSWSSRARRKVRSLTRF